jgi:hypothetical protein
VACHERPTTTTTTTTTTTRHEIFKGIQKITCKRLEGTEPSTENKCEDMEHINSYSNIWHNVTDNAFTAQSQVSFLTTATTATEA